MATAVGAVLDRNISAGRVFERAFATIRHNPGVTLGLALLFGAIPGLLATYLFTLARNSALGNGNPFLSNFMYFFYGLTLLSWVAGIIISALTQAALTRATVAESEGRRARFGESLMASISVLLPLIVLSILLGLAVILGLVLFVVPGAMLYVIWSVAVPVLVEERRGVIGSFARSRELTKGARWKIFGIVLVLLVVYWLISAVVAVYTMSAYNMRDVVLDMPIGFVAISVIAGTLINVFWGTVQASLYVELRDWKDGPGTGDLEEIFA